MLLSGFLLYLPTLFRRKPARRRGHPDSFTKSGSCASWPSYLASVMLCYPGALPGGLTKSAGEGIADVRRT